MPQRLRRGAARREPLLPRKHLTWSAAHDRAAPMTFIDHGGVGRCRLLRRPAVPTRILRYSKNARPAPFSGSVDRRPDRIAP